MSPKSALPFIAFCFALGIFLQQALGMPFPWLALAAAACFLTGMLFLNRVHLSAVMLAFLMVFLGGVYLSAFQKLPRNHVYAIAKYYYGSPVAIEGVVASEPLSKQFHRTSKINFELAVKRFRTKWGWKEKSGKIMVNLFHVVDLDYGDYVRLEGRLHRPFAGGDTARFSYREFLKRKNIQLILSVKKTGMVEIIDRCRGNPLQAASLKIKRQLQAVLLRHLSENEANIMRAVLLGERHHVPQHIRELFQVSGVAHILAISGLHIGIVAFLIFLFMKMLPLSRRLQFLCTIALLASYAFLTGGRPSVIRATIMASVFLAGFILERETESVNTLSFAALVILFMNPMNLFDVGSQLSFVSVFSILIFYPRLNFLCSGFLETHKSSFMKKGVQFFCVSLAAYLGAAGLIAYYFHIVTPVAVIANLIVVPLIAVIVSLGMGLLLAGIMWPPLAFMFAVCIKVLLNLMVAFIFLCVKVPGAYFQLDDLPLWGVVSYYFLLLFTPIFCSKKLFECGEKTLYDRH